MAHITADRVRQLSTSTGTGPFTVSGTFSGFRTFSSVLNVTDTFWYAIASFPGSQWEVGLGTYSAANTITRTTVLASSNAGAPVEFTAGDKEVFITAAASKFLQADAAGSYGNFTAGTITAALTGAASSNVLKTGDTMTGSFLTNIGGSATSTTKHIALTNGSNYDLFMLPRAAAGSYNTLTQAGDAIIGFSGGSIDSGALLIGPWSAFGRGIRIDSSGVISIGATSVNPAVTNTQTLGTSSLLWNNVYATTFTGALTGNSATATKWATARTLAGNSVDGSGNVAFSNKFISQGTADTGLSGAQFLGSLGTGILKNTTTTGVLSIAIAADFPTLNQSTTGSAATLTTSRTLWGQGFTGAANVTGNLTSVGNITGTAGVTLTATGATLALAATGTNSITASTNATTRLTITSAGDVGIGTAATTAQSLGINKNITGGATAIPLMNNGQIQTDVTGAAWMFRSSPTTVASAFTLPTLAHFSVVPGTLGASSTITNEYGALFQNTMVNATNIYGVSSNIVAQVAGGTAVATATSISQTGTTVTVNATAHGFVTGQYVTVAATANVTALTAGAWVTVLTLGDTNFTAIGGTNTVGASFTASGAGTGTGTVTLNAQGSGKNITVVDANTFTYTTTSANYTAITLLTGVITPANRWNIYAGGTAPNYFAGSVGIGYSNYAGLTNINLRLGKTMTGGTTVYGIYQSGVVQTDATSGAQYNTTVATTVGDISNILHYSAQQGTFGGAVTNQYGYLSQTTLVGATNNFAFYANNTAAVTAGKTSYGFYSNNNIATGGGTTWNFYANGTAPNYFAGAVGIGTTTPSTYGKFVSQNAVDGTTVVASFNNISNVSANTVVAVDLWADQAQSRISSNRDGAGTSSSLIFSTANASTLTEKMRIDNAGNVTPGVTNTQTLGAVDDVWSTVHANTVSAIFHESVNTISTNYTITAGSNAMTPGPITIASGFTVTVPSGSVWTIV